MLMASPLDDGIDVYPAENEGVRGKFWVRTDRHRNPWHTSLRTMGDWANPIGIEVATFNPSVVGRYPDLAKLIVDKLNEPTGEILKAEVPCRHGPVSIWKREKPDG
jgi:hypothetical protein